MGSMSDDVQALNIDGIATNADNAKSGSYQLLVLSTCVKVKLKV